MTLSRHFRILVFTALCAGAVFAAQGAKKADSSKSQPAPAASGGSQSNSQGAISEEIKGEIKESLDIQKPPPSIDLDIKEIIESGTAQTDHVLQETRPIPSDEDFNHYANLDSNQIMKAWKPLIPEPPLVSFKPGLSTLATKRWEFRVSDQSGERVKVIEGKGVPPREINWDGRNERGEYISVGTLYSYQFLTFDEHENVHTFPGDPFQLDALMYKQKNRISIEIAVNKLFQENSAELKPTIQGIWDRAIDVIRENSSHPISLEMYADNAKAPVVEERRQKLIGLISDATNIPAVDIRHKVDKVADRGNIIRLVMNVK